MHPLSPCYSASPCKIYLKSDNRLLSYGKKLFFKRRLSAVLNFLRTVFGHMAIIELEHRDRSSELLTF